MEIKVEKQDLISSMLEIHWVYYSHGEPTRARDTVRQVSLPLSDDYQVGVTALPILVMMDNDHQIGI